MATSLALIVGPGQAPAQARSGDLDGSFGAGGKVTTDFAGQADQATAVIVQSDGKVVAAGSALTSQDGNTDFALARYNPDGTLDPTFGTGGTVTTDFAKDETAASVAVQADGKLVAAGIASPSGEGARFALARYNSDGTLDPTFGSGGTATSDFDGSAVFSVNGLAVQADGELVVAGTVASGPFASFDFALARYNSDGTLDPTFGSGGTVTTDLMGGDDVAKALVMQADGRLVVAGSFSSATAFDFALARYQPNGALDPTFSKDGKVTTDFAGSDGATALALQADGKLVAAGFAPNDVGSFDFALARYQSNGALDRTFGRVGKVTTDFAGPSADDQVNGLAVQADGSLVAAGVADKAQSTADFALARYRAR